MDRKAEEVEKKLINKLYGYITVTYSPATDSIRVRITNNIEWNIVLYYFSDYVNKIGLDYVVDMIIRDYKDFIIKKYIKSEV